MFHPTSSQAPAMPSSVSPIKGYMHRIGRDPFVDWATVLVVSAALIVIGILVGISSYMNVQATFNQPPEDRFQVAIVKPEVFTDLLKSFDLRAKTYSSVLRGYTGQRDPSI